MYLSPLEQEIFDDLLTRRPDLKICADDILRAHEILVNCFTNGGTLFTCGNGGSYADALHIAGGIGQKF